LFERQTVTARREPRKVYLEQLLGQYSQPVEGKPVIQKPAQADQVIFSPLVQPLSERELEVLDLLIRGCSSGEIARCLVISVNTAKAHLKSIYQKLDVHSRQEAVEMALSLHLVPAGK
jgi:LuxR family transcriptional regulator, maltose regulon positive regulatory protein